jgi:hypothetical protein
MKTKLAALTIAALLAACGGGGGGSASTTPATDTVTSGVTTTVNTSGATAVTASANSTAYNLVADIGDSWKVNFDTAANTYTITILATQFGLTNSSANTTGSFTKTTSGKFTTYNLGSAGTLTTDDRTKGISGNLTIGSKSSTVTGTGYQASSITSLAGIYNFAYSTRNQSNGQSSDMGMGQLKIDGTTAYLCSGGKVNVSNTCDALVAGLTPELNTLSLALANGVIVASNGGNEWGRLYVHAGDLGASFLIDRYGLNASNVMRVGTLYAVKAQTLPTTTFDGFWNCSRLGSQGVTASFTGTSGTITLPNGSAGAATIAYNKVLVSATQYDAPGFTVLSKADNTKSTVLPLSSSFLIEADGGNAFWTCRKTGG